MAIPPKSANQFRYTVHGGPKRIDVGNLRSDMYADASNLQISAPGRLRIELARLVDRNPKLVLLQSGRNVRMRVSGNIGRSEEHTSELQSHSDIVCRLLLEKKKENHASRPGAHAH